MMYAEYAGIRRVRPPTTLRQPRRYKSSLRDDYWRLATTEEGRYAKSIMRAKLEAAGYKPKARAAREELADLELHHVKGYLCYDQCSLPELKTFVQDRHLESKATRKALTQALLSADANPTFHRFLDLPAELRAVVYDIHMHEFTRDPLRHPSQPPLTRTNRQLRSEALPIFFATCTFTLTPSLERERANPLSESDRYFDTLNNSYLGHMRKIRLGVGGAMSRVDLDIEMSSAGDAHTVEYACSSLESLFYIFGNAKEVVSNFMDGVVRREGMAKLTRRDVEEVLERASALGQRRETCCYWSDSD